MQRTIHTLTLPLSIILFCSFFFLTSEFNPVTAQNKKIVFIAGEKDHGFPGRHEYEKSLKLLEQSLLESENIGDVTTEYHVSKVSQDLDLDRLKDAAAIVLLSSSDRSDREVHPLFPPEPSTKNHSYDENTAEYLEQLDGLIKNGMGIVILHYTTWVEHWTAREYYFDWTGGLWVQIVSKNPNDQWSIEPIDESHPILNGVQPWEYKEEIFSRFFLPNNISGRTSLLKGTPAKSDIGPQTVAWAYHPEENHRAFVFGGIDYHDNLYLDDHRRFILNGILWSAGLEIPGEGIQSTVKKEE